MNQLNCKYLLKLLNFKPNTSQKRETRCQIRYVRCIRYFVAVKYAIRKKYLNYLGAIQDICSDGILVQFLKLGKEKTFKIKEANLDAISDEAILLTLKSVCDTLSSLFLLNQKLAIGMNM